MVRKDALSDAVSHSCSLYLDLMGYYREQQKGFSPFTSAVHVCFALQEALLELEEGGGWRQRHAHYSKLSSILRIGLADLGIKELLPAGESSSMISAFRLPDGIDYETLHSGCKNAGFVIYAGQGGLRQSIFRIANMGEIKESDINRLVQVIGGIIQ